MAAEALPAPITTSRPCGGGGKCIGMQRAGCAEAIAAVKSSRSRVRARRAPTGWLDETGGIMTAAPQAQPAPGAISKLAKISSARTIAEWSQARPPCATQLLNSSCALAVFGSDTPSARALDSARCRSF